MATTLAPTTPTQPRLLACSADELEGVRDAWSAFTWPRVDADLDFLAELVACSPEARPTSHVVALDGGMVVGRIEETRLQSRIGYRAILAPSVRMLTVAHGGLAGEDAAAGTLVDEILLALREGDADVALLPSLRVDSARLRGRALAAALAFAGPAGRGPDAPAARLPELVRRVPPETLEIDAREHQPLHEEAEAGARRPALVPRLRRRRTSSTSCSRRSSRSRPRPTSGGLGVALRDDERNRRLVALGLERGWFRTWVLYARRSAGRPSGPAGSTTARSSSARRATTRRSPTTGSGSTC